MADDLEKAIIQAYDPMISQQNRASALAYLSQVSASSGGWRTFAEKLFATSDVQVALVCLTALGDVVLHWYVLPILATQRFRSFWLQMDPHQPYKH